MRFQIFVLLSAMAIASLTSQKAKASSDSEDALSELIKVMAKRDEYLQERKARDIVLANDFLNTEDIAERVDKATRLAYRYTTINLDSAEYYFRKVGELAKEIGDSSLLTISKAHTVSLLTQRGDILNAKELFEQIDTTALRPEHLKEYYAAGGRLYLAYSLYKPGFDNENTDNIDHAGREYALKYLEKETPDSPAYNYVSAIVANIDHRQAKAMALLSDVVENSPDSSPYKTWAEEIMGVIAINSQKDDDAIVHLANAVTNDIKNGVHVGNGARILSKILMHTGDYNLADKLLEMAIDNAVISGDRMKFTQAAVLIPDMADNFKASSKRYRLWLIASLAAITALIAAIAFIYIKHRRLHGKTLIAEKKLKDADSVRIHYFNNFLNMCALYMERLDEYRRLTHRKLKAGQADELYKMLKSGEMLQEQTVKFDSIFDGAFLQAYPNFVKGINRLLQPDKQLEMPEEDSLSTDLRLLAFMRLGFDDSSRIAKFMGLSINTIYAYRNRLRSRAIDRDSFESDIMKIGQTV